jgi:RNA polymerase sigma factor (sigma-70 family)
MPSDPRSDEATAESRPIRDEALVSAYLAGDPTALEILLTRYYTIIRAYLFGLSFFKKDEGYLDDVRQQIVITLFTEIRSGKFKTAGDGSFRKWVYTVAHLECLNQDKKRRHQFKSASEVFPEETTGLPDDLLPQVTPESADYEQADQKLQEVFKNLTPEEQKLMQLVSQDKPYKEILQDPAFSKYSLAYLKLKIYNIRQKAQKMKAR